MRQINGIIVHCTATRSDWWAGKRTSEKVAEIRRWHVSDRGWRDIGYHYLIDRDGTVAKGRPLEQTGAHVAGHNTGTIGIALFGGHGASETDLFNEHFTMAQDRALRKLIADLRGQFGALALSGHNQYAAKACPGFRVASWFAGEGVTAPPADHTPPEPQPAPTGLWAALLALLQSFGKGTR
jgi:N-acetylmuramoyl-L-alanine amidase